MRSSFDQTKKMKTLDQFTAPVEMPLDNSDVDPEADSKAELNEVQKGFSARAKAEAERRELATDSEYWCCLVFQTREQAEAFAAHFGSSDAKYLDGRPVAKALSISLPASPQMSTKLGRIDPTWAKLT